MTFASTRLARAGALALGLVSGFAGSAGCNTCQAECSPPTLLPGSYLEVAHTAHLDMDLTDAELEVLASGGMILRYRTEDGTEVVAEFRATGTWLDATCLD